MTISLLYHDVVPPGQVASSGFPDGDAHIYKLETPDFERHLDKIEEATRAKVGVLNGTEHEIDSDLLLFTFDDGGVSALAIAVLLENRGWRGHFFIATDFLGHPTFLSESQVQELHQRGHVVGSHSCSHPLRMSSCGPAQMQHEWLESTRVLAEILGEQPRVASVPGGHYSHAVAQAAAAAGITLLFNSEPVNRISQVDGCSVIGRYSIKQGVSAETAARIASGEWAPRLRQYLFWNSKKVAKRVGGESYVKLRKSLLRHAGSPK